MIIDLDSHLREGYFMDEVYKLGEPFAQFTPRRANDEGRSHGTRFIHSLEPLNPQGLATHKHPYIYDPKVNWRAGEIAERQVGGYDMARRLDDIGKERIDKEILFPTGISIATQNQGRLGAAAARAFNDWVANLVKGYEDTFLPCAMAPAGCPEAMPDEVRRCVKELGFKATHLVPYVGSRNMDDPIFYPYYETVQDLDVPLFCHPNSNGDLTDRFDNFYKTHVMGRVMNCTAALIALVLGGVFEKFPASQGGVLRVQRGMDPVLDAPDGRRLRMGQGLLPAHGPSEHGAVGVRQAQLLRHLRGGRARPGDLAT